MKERKLKLKKPVGQPVGGGVTDAAASTKEVMQRFSVEERRKIFGKVFKKVFARGK